MELTLKQKTAFGIGAVGKDMVYALSASYVMYYYQDVLGLSASFVGVVLMAARFFDAFNDPFMGVLVAKTHTRWGRFRPWIFSGTLLNALVLYALFAAPVLDEAALMVYFSVVYILWGVTYTMMDIPYWSMIPAVTRTPKDRENLSMVGRTCAGVGSALIAMFTMLLVGSPWRRQRACRLPLGGADRISALCGDGIGLLRRHAGDHPQRDENMPP